MIEERRTDYDWRLFPININHTSTGVTKEFAESVTPIFHRSINNFAEKKERTEDVSKELIRVLRDKNANSYKTPEEAAEKTKAFIEEALNQLEKEYAKKQPYVVNETEGAEKPEWKMGQEFARGGKIGQSLKDAREIFIEAAKRLRKSEGLENDLEVVDEEGGINETSDRMKFGDELLKQLDEEQWNAIKERERKGEENIQIMRGLGRKSDLDRLKKEIEEKRAGNNFDLWINSRKAGATNEYAQRARNQTETRRRAAFNNWLNSQGEGKQELWEKYNRAVADSGKDLENKLSFQEWLAKTRGESKEKKKMTGQFSDWLKKMKK